MRLWTHKYGERRRRGTQPPVWVTGRECNEVRPWGKIWPFITGSSAGNERGCGRECGCKGAIKPDAKATKACEMHLH
ncbi:hypothetical protein CEXT_31031 [Caerostris extrusa]|uniref:Uncharacterized protein n=1 Tax=Caerostris extrusa TaxID=172846 RepID=A0AAV4S9A4_CAEEX|nr:hypothetical protein CEXT_31031 [Caerostris extrusa]